MLKVTDERRTHRFEITKENEDMGPRFLQEFNHLAFQVGSNVQASTAAAARPQTGNKGKQGGKNKNKKK